MYCLKYSQKLPLSIEKCWEFFSSPKNLQILTPEHLKFQITNGPIDLKMYAGQVISYTIRPIMDFPIEWVTEITHVNEPHYFVDEQRFGPYKYWHHEHRFHSIENGVEMNDTVYYKMPFGVFGKLFHCLKVKKDLDAIFSYREAKLEKLFGAYTK